MWSRRRRQSSLLIAARLEFTNRTANVEQPGFVAKICTLIVYQYKDPDNHLLHFLDEKEHDCIPLLAQSSEFLPKINSYRMSRDNTQPAGAPTERGAIELGSLLVEPFPDTAAAVGAEF